MRQIRLLGLFIICAGLVATSCRAAEFGQLTPVQTDGVYLSPPSQEVEPGQEFNLEVSVRPADYGISGSEIYLSFDSAALEVEGVEAGDVLGAAPVVGTESVDNETGVVEYSLARAGETPVPASPGTLSIIRMRVLDTAEPGVYRVDFREVNLTDEESEYLPAVEGQGASVRVSAEAAAVNYALRAEVDPSGGGYVRPDGGEYESGEVVTLTAVASEGYEFDHWRGDLTGERETARLVMDSDKWVVANFSPVEVSYALRVEVNPSGGGYVRPDGGEYDSGEVVTLTAVTSEEYEFDHWSSDLSGDSATASLVMDSDKWVVANFVRVEEASYTLSVRVDPSGGGYIRPDGGEFDSGEVVTLTAVAYEGYEFDHWSSDLSGDSATASLVMDSDKWVVANFSPVEERYTLVVKVEPSGGGYVRPDGGEYDSGEVVTLTAVAYEGYEFDHWSGDLSGDSETTRLVMDSDKGVGAHFNLVEE